MKSIFKNESIEFYGILPFSACKCRRPDIIERRGVRTDEIKSVIMLLVPYYVSDGAGNVSLYARSGDYHYYCDGLFERILPKLEGKYGARFFGFADKSPIEENAAASMAGLGVIGDNYMLINEKYGSFVFLAEILSTAEPGALGFSGKVSPPSYCSHCGACKKACPMVKEDMECLSAVTQKKGVLTKDEESYLRRYGSAWGCDLCQLACPLNKKALASGIETPLDFFRNDRISTLTAEMLHAMSDETFKRRSFSWRGKAPLLRNLEILSREEE